MASRMTAWQFLNRVHSMLGERPKDAVYEGRLNRTLYAPIEGVLVANEPSVKAVRLAVETGRNCIVCRDHPYYLYGEHWSRSVEDLLRQDAVVTAKRKLIEDNQLLLLRLGALWDTVRPNWFSEALARSLGWQVNAPSAADRWSPVSCDVPGTTLVDLSRQVARRLETRTMRIVGDPSWSIRRVAVIHGHAFPTVVFAQALKDPEVDLVLTGATPEVDFNTTYIRDAISAGRKVGLIQVGYERSEEPGASEVGDWLRTAFPGMPIDVQPRLPELASLA